MDKDGKFKVSCSITDFPVLSTLGTAFKKLEPTGVDGIELVIGLKSRHRIPAVQKLAAKYNLSIISIHQPPWSGLNIYFDEGFIKQAAGIGVKTITFHPLPWVDFKHKLALRYFAWLAKMQEKYGITVCLENMPGKASIKWIDAVFPSSADSTKFLTLLDTANTYNFKLTYDVSHAMLVDPTANKDFSTIFPSIGNIHLSSFSQKKQHLPLTMGDFQYKPFLQYLRDRKYEGLLTFEIYYPKIFSIKRFEYPVIHDSLVLVKEA